MLVGVLDCTCLTITNGEKLLFRFLLCFASRNCTQSSREVLKMTCLHGDLLLFVDGGKSW